MSAYVVTDGQHYFVEIIRDGEEPREGVEIVEPAPLYDIYEYEGFVPPSVLIRDGWFSSRPIIEEVEVNPEGGRQSRLDEDFTQLDIKALWGLTSAPDSGLGECLVYLFNAGDVSNTHLAGGKKREVYSMLVAAFDSLVNHRETQGDLTDVERHKTLGQPLWVWRGLAKTRAEGAKKYTEENWKLIGYRSHVNHAINHVLLWSAGDKSEGHLNHALTRIFLAVGAEVLLYEANHTK